MVFLLQAWSMAFCDPEMKRENARADLDADRSAAVIANSVI
jgi:hypothetical protein